MFRTANRVELNIDDTPDLITITCFNPVRREVARLALEHLIRDGRIQPGRIEEVVKKYQDEIDQEIMKAGGRKQFSKLGIGRIDREIVKLIWYIKISLFLWSKRITALYGGCLYCGLYGC